MRQFDMIISMERNFKNNEACWNQPITDTGNVKSDPLILYEIKITNQTWQL